MGYVPTVTENEGGNRERSFDIYSRLLKDRIILIGRPIDDIVANLVVAQLMYLAADGTLSAAEWEQARAAARQQVLEGRAAAPLSPSVNVLGDPNDGRAFLLAVSDGESLAQRFRRRALAGVGGFVGSTAALTWMLTHV